MSGQLKILTLNVNGLRDNRKLESLAAWLNFIRPEILFLQETHAISNSDITAIKKKIGATASFYSHGTTRSCGVATFLMPSFAGVPLSYRTDDAGRLISLDVSILGQRIRTLNLYAPNKPRQRTNFFRNLDLYLEGPFDDLVIAGDFNCVPDAALDRRSTGRTYVDKTVATLTNFSANFQLLDIWRTLHPGVFDFTWEAQGVQSRLDRIYAPLHWTSQPLTCEIVTLGGRTKKISDHRSVCLTTTLAAKTVSLGPGIWRLNTSLLENLDFCEEIEETINILTSRFDDCPPDEAWAKLKLDIANHIRARSKKLAHAKRKTCNFLRFAIRNLQNLKPQTELNLSAIEEFQNQLNTHVIETYKYAAIKREGLRLHGEENYSAGFYRALKSKHDRPLMDSLSINGNVIRGKAEVEDAVHLFYQDLYTPTQANEATWPDLWHPLKQIDPECVESTKGPFTQDECKKALSSMGKDKAPGPDGFPAGFFLKFWKLLGPYLSRALNYATTQNHLGHSINDGVITLLPKDLTDIENLGAWRPISLLNIDRKTYAKILDTRMSALLPGVICPTQTGGVKGRSIHSNLIFLRDAMDYCKERTIPGFLISLDQAKAFDRVNHRFLFGTLRAMGFPEEFVDMVQVLYHNGRSKILVNGHTTKEITISQGVRQGCPLSPALFAVVAEVLAATIRCKPGIKRINLPIKENILTLQHSDDTNILVPDADSVEAVFSATKSFCDASGAKLNVEKTKILRIGLGRHDTLPLSGPQPTNGPIRILGVWFNAKGVAPNNVRNFTDFLQKAVKEPAFEELSMLAKAQVVRTKFLPKITYGLPLIQATKLDLVRWEGKIYSFLWAGKQESIARKTLALPTSRGGLNIPDLKLVFDALTHARICKLMVSSDHPMTALTGFNLSTPLKTLLDLTWDPGELHRHDVAPLYKNYVAYARTLLSLKASTHTLVKLSTKTCVTLSLKSRKPRIEGVFPTVDWPFSWKMLSSRYIEGKRRDLALKLAHDALPLRKALFCRGMVTNKGCPFCNMEESATHAFYTCTNATLLRNHLKNFFGVRYISVTTILYHQPAPVHPELFYVFNLILAEMKYQLWLTRNKKVFDDKFETAAIVRERIRHNIVSRAKIDHLRMEMTLFNSRWCNTKCPVIRCDDHELVLLL